MKYKIVIIIAFLLMIGEFIYLIFTGNDKVIIINLINIGILIFSILLVNKNKIFGLFKKSQKKDPFAILTKENKINYTDDFIKDFWETIRYYNSHYLFVLITVFFIISLIDYFFVRYFGLNFYLINFLLLILSFFASFREIKNGHIFLGRRQISKKDLFFFINILIIFGLFIYLKDFSLDKKLFFSFLGGFLFYIIGLNILGFTKSPFKIFGNIFVKLYLILFIFIFIYFIWEQFPNVRNIFIKEIIIENSNCPIEKTVTFDKNKTSLDKIEKINDQNFVYNLSNSDRYLIVKDENGYFIDLNVYDRVYFNSLSEGKNFIDMNYANIIYKKKTDIIENEKEIVNVTGNQNIDYQTGNSNLEKQEEIEEIIEKYKRDFNIGDSGDDIKNLQLFLSNNGFWPENINKSGYFGSITLEWSKKYLMERHEYNLTLNYISKSILNQYFQ